MFAAFCESLDDAPCLFQLLFHCLYTCSPFFFLLLTLDPRKYGTDGEVLKKWSGDDADGKRKEKEEASELFKSYWRRCTSDEKYVELKEQWKEEKKEFQKS